MPPSALSAHFLAPEDWHQLEAIEPFKTRGLPDDPANWWILTVEREDAGGRRLVGTCSLFTAMHWDAWWIDPEESGAARGVILRKLLRAALDLLDQAEVRQVYTGVEDQHPDIASLLTRFGFRPAGGHLFMLQVADASTACSREA